MRAKNLKLQAKLTRALGSPTGSSAKKGMASFYVVIFAMLVFIVLVLTFINLMLSEFLQSSGSDLSTSALDSAQAGVEDAKTAVLKCLNETGSLDNCVSLFSGSCDSVSVYLYGETGEVEVGETDLNQAYTCVILANEVDSLKSTLSPGSASSSYFVVPLYEANGNYNRVQVSWYSEAEQDSGGTSPNTLGTFLDSNTQAGNLPIVAVQLIDADMSGGALTAIASAEEKGAAILVPTSSGKTEGKLVLGSTVTLDGTTIKKEFSNDGSNSAVAVKCTVGNAYACNYEITGDIENIEYLVVTNPYNDRDVSIEVVACKDNCDSGKLTFSNVQVEVDSTGRASNYYRRVEARLSLSNLDVPMPIYSLNLGGDGDSDALSKNFAVTRNCWAVLSGTLSTCDNGKSL